MLNTDYIIVGCGLASVSFCEQLKANNKSFIVYDDSSQKSSIVAAGLYNPVILKRFSEVWKANEQLKIALLVYSKIEKELQIKIDHKLRILRRFTSIEEQNKWFIASDNPSLENYLSTKLIKNTNQCIDAAFGFGEVLHAGRIDTEILISKYKKSLRNNNQLIEAKFDYDAIQFKTKTIQYKNTETTQIVFAEGFGVKQNPYFKTVALTGSKGEIITINAPDLNIDYAIKSSVFVIPLGNSIYNVGATYNNEDKTHLPTESAKQQLLTKVKTFLKCNFEVINHKAGIRPTVKDRRPLVGQHTEHKNLYILNGLGSRGVMVAPYVADQLFQYIENNKALNPEIDVNRFG